MKKKLGISLREPVKIYHTAEPLPSAESIEANDQKAEVSKSESPVKDISPNIPADETHFPEPEFTDAPNDLVETKPPRRISVERPTRTQNALETMSERTYEIWKCLVQQAAGENKLQRSFIVTRAQIMSEAKVGSTNTYRLALQKLQELGLLKIELRPGVTSGSVFHLTAKGIELARTFLPETTGD